MDGRGRVGAGVAGPEEVVFLGFPLRGAGFEAGQVAQEAAIGGGFEDAAREAAAARDEVLPPGDGRMEPQAAGGAFDGGHEVAGDALEHFEFHVPGGMLVVAERDGVGDVEEVVGGDGDAGGGVPLGRFEREMEHPFEIRVGFHFPGEDGGRPAAQRGVGQAGGAVAAFDKPDGNGRSTGGGASHGPGGEFFLDGDGNQAGRRG